MSLNLTRREWLILTCTCGACFASGITYSLQGPIYPPEASKKGASAWQYGLVFGVYELVNFIVCPIYGKYIDLLGTKFLVIAGMITAGCSTIMFGFLDQIFTLSAFLGFSFVLRAMQAMGSSATFTACFTILAQAFKKNIATIFAINEVFFGLGFSLGPTIGGFLYQVGGFLCPFLVIGILMVFVALVSNFVFPNNADEVHETSHKAGQLWTAMKLKPVLLDLLSVFAIHFSIGFYMPTLEPHLRQFHLTPVHVGAIFAIDSGVYMITTPLVGLLCDTSLNPKYVILLGSVLVMGSFSLIGPLPFLPTPTMLWMVYLGMASQGFAISCIMVPCFIDAIRSGVEGGLSDDLTTYGLMVGLSTSAVALGNFVGSSVAGVLFDTVGFRYGTLVVLAIFLLLIVLLVWFLCADRIKKRVLPSHSQFQNSASTETLAVGAATPADYGSMAEKEGDWDAGNIREVVDAATPADYGSMADRKVDGDTENRRHMAGNATPTE